MHRILLALATTTALCLATAAVAVADPGPIQVSGQSAATTQQAGAASSATQIDPSNTNVSIRVLSPGNDGDVTQSNSATSSATAGNQAATTQNAAQDAAGAAIQTAQQTAGTDQVALALSAANQDHPSNVNVPIRVLSPGNDGSVTQGNSATSTAASGNTATTNQTGSQDAAAAPCGCNGTGVQTAKQSADTGQTAGAASGAVQDHPSNTAVSIRVLSPGDGGSVTQTNTATSAATAGNTASTTQNASQGQGGSCGCAIGRIEPDTQRASGAGVQTGDQHAETSQLAGALSVAKQDHPSNTASSVRVLSPGDDGSVSQTNAVNSAATAGNAATTTQDASQSQGGTGIQVAGQDASTEQGALAGSFADQHGASNDASPVRVLSPGDGGSVTQANTVGSTATAGNTASTTQKADQASGAQCGCGGTPIQVAGQKAETGQGAVALSKADQAFGGLVRGCGCGGSSSGNDASPVRVWSPGMGGDVNQQNTVGSTATAGNSAATTQDASQGASGGGLAVQVAGQKAETGQLAFAASLAAQLGASNTASPTRVKSPGDDGSVSQTNAAGSTATAGNDAATTQDGRQSIGRGECGCGGLPIQVIGQQAGTDQLAKAISAALQLYPSNDSSPLRVWSRGGQGSATQSNASTSRGDSGNRATTDGEAMQES